MCAPRCLFALALWCLPVSAFAAPRDDLLRLVPDDYTFCLVVQDLRSVGKGEGNSLLKVLGDSPIFKNLQETPEAKKFQAVMDAILKDLNVTPQQFRDDLLGDALVFAYRKGPPDQKEKEDGLMLLYARDEKLLSRIVDRINELQIRSGELKGIETVSGKNGSYVRRLKAAEKDPPDFYAIRGHQFLYSGSESLLQDTLSRPAPKDEPEPLVSKRLKQLGVNESTVAFLINPRSFDADLVQSTQAAKGSERAFQKEFGKYWKAVDGVALFANLSPTFEIGLAIHGRKKDLPPETGRFLTEAGKRSPLWNSVPEDALIALVGRIDLESLARMLGSFLISEDRQKVLDGLSRISKTFLKPAELEQLARGFGPDGGFWVLPPDPKDRTWCPQAMLAIKLSEGPEGRKAEQAALKGLDFLTRLASLSNSDLEVFEETRDNRMVTGLASAKHFPPGFRPCFTASNGYLLVAGSPETVSRFSPPTVPATEADEVPILRISVAGWRSYLTEHRKGLTDYLAQVNNTDAATLNAQIELLMPLLSGLDRIELVQRTGPDRVSLILRFKGMAR